MADVQNFVIPESNFGGLYKLSDTIQRKQEKKDEIARQQTARKGAVATFLSNYLDPKDSLTGTNYDPQIVKGFDDLMQEGTKLASQGADANMIMMALSPGVAKLNQYSTKAKLVNQRIKDQLTQIPANAGYDKAKLEQIAKRTAFYDDKGELKDINTIDPDTDWLTETVKKYPDQVTTDAAIDEFVKSSPKFTNTQSVKRINSRGGYEYRKAKVTAPSWAIVDDDGNIVPRYEVALEGGKPHSFNFGTGQGTAADIRMMNERDFDSLMASNPGIADWVRGQVMKAGKGVDISSPQAKNAARAIMYDELKRRGGGGIEDIEITKENPAPRISIKNIIPSAGNGGGVSGNEFDRIQVPGIKKTFLGLSTGKREKLSPDALPERVYAILKSAGMDVSGAVYFDTELGENGEIQSIIPYFDYRGKDEKQPNIQKGSRITRQDMFDAQLKYNAEPQKGAQPTFGERAEPRLPKNITETRMQPRAYKVGGKTFTQEQIEKAAKKYNMTVEQYLKSIGVQ